jgi:hypothetical protein
VLLDSEAVDIFDDSGLLQNITELSITGIEN